MFYIAVGVLTVLWVVAAFMLVLNVLEAADGNSDNAALIYTITALFFSLSIAWVIYLIDSEDKKGPCVKYETQMHYNAAIKTMMPTRVCVVRGEWVE